MTKPEKCFSSMSDTAMYDYIKKLVHSTQKHTVKATKSYRKGCSKGCRKRDETAKTSSTGPSETAT
jgi:hypothetical protein